MADEDGGRPGAADADPGAVPGLVVEKERLPDGRSITWFSSGSAGDGAP